MQSTIALFTDFGSTGPYVGQLRAVLQRHAPGVAIIDLMHDAPSCDPRAAAYLLPGIAAPLPPPVVFLCVVDPGVGGVREPVVLVADGRYFVGPENGLFEIVARRSAETKWWYIDWQPQDISTSFHGRDLFAPMAAKVACNGVDIDELKPISVAPTYDWPNSLKEIVYIDGYGNCMTGVEAEHLNNTSTLKLFGKTIEYAATFSCVEVGKPFWYRNSIGLAEIAINQGGAAAEYSAVIGTPVAVIA